MMSDLFPHGPEPRTPGPGSVRAGREERPRSGPLSRLAAFLARWRHRGQHHVPAAPVAPERVPEPAGGDWGVSAAEMTSLDLLPPIVRPYIPQQRGRHRGG